MRATMKTGAVGAGCLLFLIAATLWAGAYFLKTEGKGTKPLRIVKLR